MKNNQKGFVALLSLVLVTVFGLAGIGTVVAAGDSEPGDTLFPVKQAMDTIRHPFEDKNTLIVDDDKIRVKNEFELRGKLDELEDATDSGKLNQRGREDENKDHLRGGQNEQEIRGREAEGEIEIRGREAEGENHLQGEDDNRVNDDNSDDATSHSAQSVSDDNQEDRGGNEADSSSVKAGDNSRTELNQEASQIKDSIESNNDKRDDQKEDH